MAKIIGKLSELKLWSFVHENGDTEEENPTPCEHTHVFIWCKKAMDTKDAVILMVGYTPEFADTPLYFKGENNMYEVSFGTQDEEGREEVFVAPIYLHQEGFEIWKMDEDEMETVKGAPSLDAACVELGIRQKSVGDVHVIRQANNKRKATVLDPRCDINLFKPIEWDRSCALILRGPRRNSKD